MDNPFKKISIIGLGLIGGSIGLATRRYDKKIHIQGFAKNQSTLDVATSRGFVDEAFLNLIQIYSDTDLVILASPLSTFKNIEGRGNTFKINFLDKSLSVINESYNANPNSMEAAILSFDQLK